METLQQTYSFRIINNTYPDLVDYNYIINIPNMDIQIVIKPQIGTNKLYIVIDDNYIIPFRINTNLLPCKYNNYKLIYNNIQQQFEFYYITT